MKRVDRIFKFLERASETAPAEQRYGGNLVLKAEPGRLIFIQDSSTRGAVQFLSWFRWVFLALCSGLALFIHQALSAGGGSLLALLGGALALAAVGVGLAGALLVIPALQKLFSRLETLGARGSARLPSFDLIGKAVQPPDGSAAYPFASVAGLKREPGADGWRKLVLLTVDGRAVFLVNYPRRAEASMATMLGEIAARTSIRILD